MKTLLLTIICIIAGTTIANAQLSGQARIDSLLKELPKMKQDTNAVNLLKNLSIEYLPINPDEGIKYGEQGLQLANDINWLEGKAKCNGAIGMNYSFGKSDYSNAMEFFRESLKLYTEVGNLEMMIYTLQNIGDIHDTQSKYEEAKKYYTQGLELIKNDEFIIYKANLLKRIAFIYRAQGDFMNALEHHYKALKIYEAEGDTIYFAGELHNIANNYIAQSNYPRALDYLHQALKINEEIGNFRWKANNLLAISLVYGHISEHEKALEYNQQALKLFEEMDNQFAIAAVLHNIGANYSDISEYEKAKDYYLRAMKMNEEMGNLQWLSNNLASLGNIYLHYLDYSKALEYYERSLSISEEIGDKSGIAANLGSIGSFYLSLSQDSIINKSEKKVQMLINKDLNLANSIKYLQRALALQKETGELKSQFSTLFHLSNAYELKGDYKKAFEAYKEYKTLQDSVFSMDRQKELANLDAKRENELKDAEIVILQTQKKAQQFQSYLLGGGVIVLLGAFGVAFLRFREKKKLSDKLALQNAEICCFDNLRLYYSTRNFTLEKYTKKSIW